MCAAHFIEGKSATAMLAAQGKRIGELEEALFAASSAAPGQEILRGGRSPAARRKNLPAVDPLARRIVRRAVRT